MSDELENVSGAEIVHELRRRNPENKSYALLDDNLLYTSTPEQTDEDVLVGRRKSKNYNEERNL